MKLSTLSILLVSLFASPLFAQRDLKAHDYRKADSVAALYTEHSIVDMRRLADELTVPFSSDEDKFRAIYTWVCLSIENDYGFYVEADRMRKKLSNKPEALKTWNEKFNARVFKKLIAEHKTVCSGYAYLIKELSSLAGISCVIVGGYGRTARANIGGVGIPNHSWNAVQLTNKWYLCDATWSSGAIDIQSQRFVPKYDDAYFLADPALFVRNHYPLDSSWMLLKNKPTLQQFLDRPLIYSSMYHYGIDKLFPETFNVKAAKRETVSFQFRKNNDVAIGKVELLVNNVAYSPFVYKNIEGMYCVDQIFNSKGTYIVHARMDNKYLFTYTVKVD